MTSSCGSICAGFAELQDGDDAHALIARADDALLKSPLSEIAAFGHAKPNLKQLLLARRAGLCGRRSAEHLANLAGDLEVFAGGDDEGSDAGLMACEVGVAGGGPVFVVVDG